MKVDIDYNFDFVKVVQTADEVLNIFDEEIQAALLEHQPQYGDDKRCTMAIPIDPVTVTWIAIPCTKTFPVASVIFSPKKDTLYQRNVSLSLSTSQCPKHWRPSYFPNTTELENCWTVQRCNSSTHDSRCTKEIGTEIVDFRQMDLYPLHMHSWFIHENIMVISTIPGRSYLFLSSDGRYHLSGYRQVDMRNFIPSQCSHRHWSCLDGTCILSFRRCDGVTDCPDGSDEEVLSGGSLKPCFTDCYTENCSCSDMHFQCDDWRCIPISKLLDSQCDCASCIDEKLLEENLTMAWGKTKRDSVMAGEMQSDYHNILLAPCSDYGDSFYHVGDVCMFNHHDRSGCLNGRHLIHCQRYECRDTFKCVSAYCIPFFAVCNGRKDCPNGEDEENCDTLQCAYLLKCSQDDICIHPSNECDDIIHCPFSGDDEALCDVQPCPSLCICVGHAVNCAYRDLIDLPDAINYAKMLKLSYNRINPHNLRFDGFSNLLFLDLSYNDFTFLPTTALQSMPFLLTLNLEGNLIQYLSPDMFKQLLSLKFITLRHNPLYAAHESIFAMPSFLITIDLAYTALHVLQPNMFFAVPSVERLDLQQGKIGAIYLCTFCRMLNLKYLDLRGNPLVFISVDAFLFPNLPQKRQIYFSVSGWCCLILQHKIQCQSQSVFDFKRDCPHSFPSSAFRQIFYFVVTCDVLIVFIGMVAIILLNLSSMSPFLLRRNMIQRMNKLLSNICLCLFLLLLVFIEHHSLEDFRYIQATGKKDLFCEIARTMYVLSVLPPLIISCLINGMTLRAVRQSLDIKSKSNAILYFISGSGWIFGVLVSILPNQLQLQDYGDTCIIPKIVKTAEWGYILMVVILTLLLHILNLTLTLASYRRAIKLKKTSGRKLRSKSEENLILKMFLYLASLCIWATVLSFLSGMLLSSSGAGQNHGWDVVLIIGMTPILDMLYFLVLFCRKNKTR